ncbi:MAG: sulfatase-like hydrolase/transferase, partial [bacterium]
MIEKKKKLVIFLFISLFILGLADAVSASRLNILLVTFDTTRADHIRCYGYKDIKTPNIDRLAKEGCLFEKAFTPVPITFPSHASMLTGLYPPAHGIRNNATYALSDSVITLPELLKERGYKTAAFVSAYVLDKRFGLDQGFDIYDDDLETGVEAKLSQKERRAETVTRAAIKWLERVGDENFFLWIHYFDPHDAWSPPPPYSNDYASNPYDGEIAYADYWLGKLLDKLDSKRLTQNTLIVLAGDHGEGLGDHHERTHGIFIYDTTIWVPLIFSCPRILPKSRRISSLVRLVDITPTILEIIAYKIPEHMQGVSLSPWMLKKAKMPELAIYCETFYPKSTHNWSPLKGIRTETWKYIEAPVKELYRLDKDPHEKVNLFKKEKDQAETMAKEFAKLVRNIKVEETVSKTLELDKEMHEKLRSLGYVWTPTSGEERKEYPDPKEMINVLEYIDKGAAYFAEAQYEKAAPLFKKVLELHPEDTEAYVTLGHIYEAMEDNEKSIESFKQALKLEPENLRIYIQLGVSYMKTEQYEKGMETFKRARDFNPRCK